MNLFSPAIVSICSVLLAALVVLVHGVHGLPLVVECVHTLLGQPVSNPEKEVMDYMCNIMVGAYVILALVLLKATMVFPGSGVSLSHFPLRWSHLMDSK